MASRAASDGHEHTAKANGAEDEPMKRAGRAGRPEPQAQASQATYVAGMTDDAKPETVAFPIWHRAKFELNVGSFEYDLRIPADILSDLSEVRMSRRGGDAQADHEFRSQLYVRIGAVTVAAGRVETAMRRLLVVLSEGAAHFSPKSVKFNWSELEERLNKQAGSDPQDDRRRNLATLLAWAKRKQIKDRRDDVIHAEWWDFAEVGVVRSRFSRKADGATIFGSLERLEQDAKLLREYALKLDDLIEDHEWATALLLPLP